MGFEGQPNLHHAEAEQNHTDGTDKAENKVAQIVDYGQRVIGGKGRRWEQAEQEHQRSVQEICPLHNALHSGAGGFLLLFHL